MDDVGRLVRPILFGANLGVTITIGLPWSGLFGALTFVFAALWVDQVRKEAVR